VTVVKQKNQPSINIPNTLNIKKSNVYFSPSLSHLSTAHSRMSNCLVTELFSTTRIIPQRGETRFSYLKDNIWFFTSLSALQMIFSSALHPLTRATESNSVPSSLDKASRYDKRCVEFHRAGGASRRPISAAYFRTSPSGAKRARTHTREKTCVDACGEIATRWTSFVRACVRACVLTRML